jgi:antitoxin component HigA of HigAB toxin-antitoxin module
MDQHRLKQSDLLDAFGTLSAASSVLSGKLESSKEHIPKLAGIYWNRRVERIRVRGQG